MSKEDATVEQVRKSLQGSINISTKNIDIMRRKCLPNHYETFFDLLRAQMHLHERFIKTIQNWRK